MAARTGDRVPAYGAAAGKILLAALSPEEIRDRYPDGLSRLTGATLPDVDALLAQLACARARGYAVNLDESVVGVHAVGVPICDAGGRAFASVTVAGPAVGLTRQRATELIPSLRRTAAGIQAALAI